MFVSRNSQTRVSFADANGRHPQLYSRHHKSKYFCGTCHDLSNPALANLGRSGLPDSGNGLMTEQYASHRYFHVERTFSEFMLSAYGQQGGAPAMRSSARRALPTSPWWPGARTATCATSSAVPPTRQMPFCRRQGPAAAPAGSHVQERRL
jgi:hypothetical protein